MWPLSDRPHNVATMSDTMSPEETARRARELLDTRVQIVENLARLARDQDAAQAAAAMAERTFAAAYAEAERAGWTSAELTSLAIRKPERRAPGRPRSARRPSRAAGADPTTD